ALDEETSCSCDATVAAHCAAAGCSFGASPSRGGSNVVGENMGLLAEDERAGSACEECWVWFVRTRDFAQDTCASLLNEETATSANRCNASIGSAAEA